MKKIFRFFEPFPAHLHLKKCTQKSYQPKRDGNMHFFSLLLMFVKLVLLVTFFWCIFLPLFQRILNQREILRFWYLFGFFCQKIVMGHISTFGKLWSQMRKKRLKKSKNVFCKCVLDFNFAPITGSVLFIFLKKSNSFYPIGHGMSCKIPVF